MSSFTMNRLNEIRTNTEINQCKCIPGDLNPIQDRGVGGKKPPSPFISFPSVTSTNVGISTQNFLTFSFNPYTTLV